MNSIQLRRTCRLLTQIKTRRIDDERQRVLIDNMQAIWSKKRELKVFEHR